MKMAEIDGTREPAFSAEAAAEWNRHVDSALRGVAHGLNNRAATLSALMELTTEPVESPAVIHSILGTELERVQAIVRVIRAIGTPRGAVEAFTPDDAANEALAVLELYPEHRDAAVTFDSAKAEPVRVVRWMFVRALMGVAAGMRTPTSRGRKVTIAAAGDWLEVTGDAPHQATPLVAELARAMGGEPLGDRYGFRVPTLAALRRREGR